MTRVIAIKLVATNVSNGKVESLVEVGMNNVHPWSEEQLAENQKYCEEMISQYSSHFKDFAITSTLIEQITVPVIKCEVA